MKAGRTIFRVFLFIFIMTAGVYSLPGFETGFTVVAGKDTTEDGSVLVAHSEADNTNPGFVNMYRVNKMDMNTHKDFIKTFPMLPEAPKKYDFWWIEIPNSSYGDSYINENGVVITSNTCISKEDRSVTVSGGIGIHLRRLVAEQAISARHAAEIAGQLIQQIGYQASGRAYVFADASEAWILHVIQGKHWAAARVPDNKVVVISNRFVIDNVNLEDKRNFMGSSDIIQYAIKRGWYTPKKNGAFNFAAVYSSAESYNARINWLRQWRGVSLLSRDRFNPRDMLPFSFVPRYKLKPGDLFTLLRDHYEETEFAPASDASVSPNQSKYNTICTEDIRYSFVAHLRDGLPTEFANLFWLSLTGPDTNAFSPWYISVTEPPEGYSTGNAEIAFANHFKYPKSIYTFNPENAYSYYSRLTTLINQRYMARYNIARKEWENFEAFVLKSQRKMEKEFAYMVKKNKIIALKHISNYVYKMEYRKWFLTSELIGEVSKK